MPHNNTENLIGRKYPYREHEYIQEETKFLQKANHQDKNQVLEFNRKIYLLKEQNLMEFLKTQNYYYVSIEKDGNCGPRAIAVFIHGIQIKWS